MFKKRWSEGFCMHYNNDVNRMFEKGLVDKGGGGWCKFVTLM